MNDPGQTISAFSLKTNAQKMEYSKIESSTSKVYILPKNKVWNMKNFFSSILLLEGVTEENYNPPK